jgi:phage tail-like protein
MKTIALFPSVMLRIWFVAAITASNLVLAAATEEGGYQVIANAFGFGMDIPGCADASKNVREISIDELNIDVRELTTGIGVQSRLYGPGKPHYGSATFTSAVTLGASKELQAWFNDAAKGKNIRKNITVTLFKSDKTAGRSYTLMDCFPTQWSSVDFDPNFGGPTETIQVQIGSIEFKTKAPPCCVSLGPDGRDDRIIPADAPAVGFSFDIRDGGLKEVDSAWESVSGGEMIIELTETSVGSDKFHTQSPGHKSIEKITLRGAMTDKRAALCTWLNDTLGGNSWQRMGSIVQITLIVFRFVTYSRKCPF